MENQLQEAGPQRGVFGEQFAASASWLKRSVRQAVSQTTVVEYRRGARNPDQPTGVQAARLRPTSMSSLPSSIRL